MFLEKDIYNRVRIADVITQVNAVEFEINDIIANHKVKELSEVSYLKYIEEELIDKRIRIREKSSMLISILEETDSFRRLDPTFEDRSKVEETINEWLSIRNRFAHGHIVENSKGIPTIYYNGECFDIENNTGRFFCIQSIIIEILGKYEELHSPFFGKPVFKNPLNTPDNPK